MTETTAKPAVVHPIPVGTEVRTTATATVDGPNAVVPYRKGQFLVIEEYVSGAEAADGEPFYWCNEESGLAPLIVDADHVEVVRTAAERRARKVPTLDEARTFIGQLCGQEDDRIEINEVDYTGTGDNPVYLYGRTEEGLPITIAVKVLAVQVRDF